MTNPPFDRPSGSATGSARPEGASRDGTDSPWRESVGSAGQGEAPREGNAGRGFPLPAGRQRGRLRNPNGGGGGNRTRVRKPSTATSTCLAASWRGTAPESAFPFSPPRRIDPASRGVGAIPGVSPPARENRRLSPPRRRPFPPGRRDQEGRDGLSRQSQFSVVGLCVVSTIHERWTLGMQSLLPVPSSNPVRPLLFGEIFR